MKTTNPDWHILNALRRQLGPMNLQTIRDKTGDAIDSDPTVLKGRVTQSTMLRLVAEGKARMQIVNVDGRHELCYSLRFDNPPPIEVDTTAPKVIHINTTRQETN